jgi:hypothetical protein
VEDAVVEVLAMSKIELKVRLVGVVSIEMKFSAGSRGEEVQGGQFVADQCVFGEDIVVHPDSGTN